MVSNSNQAKAPISSHPAFPAIVALWFAALLGIGSLIVPPALFEHLFAVSGLSEIFSATKAPLGFTAKMLIAVAGSVIGAVTGLLLARKVAATQSAPAASEFDQGHFPSAKPPIFALEELGAQSLDQPVDDDNRVEPAHVRRRALFIPEEEIADHYSGQTPLATRPAPQAEDFAEPEPEPAPAADEWPEDWTGGSVGDSSADASDTNQLDAVEPAEEAPDEVEPASPEPPAADLAAAELAPQANAQNPATGMTAKQLVSRPLDELGIVQLVERFALSLQQRPATDFQAAEETPEDVLPEDEFMAPDMMRSDFLGETDSPLDIAGRIPAKLPDALRPVGFGLAANSLLDDEEEGDQEDDLPLVDWKTAFSANNLDGNSAFDSGRDSDDETQEDEEFSSLLNLRKTTGEPRKSVELPEDSESDASETVAVFPSQEDSLDRRKFDPPVAVAAAQARPSDEGSAADRERTLRDALEQLQKMSGVG